MNGLIPLSEGGVQALGWMLLHFVWQGFAMAAILAGTRVVIKSPRLRYILGCGALLAMVALAVSTLLTQDVETRSRPELSGAYFTEIPLPADADAPTLSPDEPTHRPPGLSQQPVQWTSLTKRLQDHLPEIVICWLLGVLLLSLRLLGGCWVCRRLKHTGTRPLPEALRERVRDLIDRLNISHRVSVLTSSVASVPMVVGVLRPVVLIPIGSLLGLTPYQLEAILVHELAHVRRYDNLVNLLQRLVETVFFFHPAVWWVSGCIRTEREHCCDDVAAAASDPKLYAVALTELEGLRSPSLAAAATDGPLLSRVKRLVALDRAAPGGRSRFTVSNLLGILVVLAVAVLTLESTLIADQTKEKAMGFESDQTHSSKILDIQPAGAFTRAVNALHPMLQAAGQSEWSVERLTSVLGNAFSFEMRKGGGMVWQEANTDWWQFLPGLELGVPVRRYETRNEQDGALVLKAAAWEAVRASIDRGIPAVAMSPMSSKSDSPRDWGLLVGYDESNQTYTVRRHSGEIIARYDEIGIPGPSGSFRLLVYHPPGSADSRSTHLNALQNAVAFANGTRFENQTDPYPVDARGFAAFELWGEAIASGAPTPEQRSPKSGGIVSDSRYHSEEVRVLRGYAAAYLRELVNLFPAASSELEKAAAHYDGVVEASAGLVALFDGAKDAGEFTAEARAEAADLIAAALQAERDAIAGIESALVLVNESH